jgi:serine/threonine-protein kinase
VSPDGRWIAYESDDTGQYEVYVARFPDLSDRQQISTSGGRSPLWSRNGHELFYRRPDGPLISVAVTPGDTLKTGAPTVVLRGPYYSGNGLNYDVAPDGQRFLLMKDDVKADDAAQAGRIFYVENWSDELK